MFQYHCLNPIAGVELQILMKTISRVKAWREPMRFSSEVQPCTVWSCRKVFLP